MANPQSPNDLVTELAEPRPPDPDAPTDVLNSYISVMKTFFLSWIEQYSDLSAISAELIWSDFTEDFSSIGLQHMDKATTVKLRDFLMTNGIKVKFGRGIPIKRSLIEVLVSTVCPVIDGDVNNEIRSNSDHNTEHNESISTQDQSKREGPIVVSGKQINVLDVSVKNEQNTHENTHDHRQENTNNRALDCLSKAYSGRKRYGGNWDEDILEAIEVYEVSCDMYKLTNDQRRAGISVMLTDNALSFYASTLKALSSYEEVIDRLKSWFSSEEKQTRLLEEWRNASLSKWMTRNPEKSQLQVFKDLASHLSKIQRQLHPDYRRDRFLRDQLLSSTDVQEVAKFLRGCHFDSAQAANQRIASLLSSEPKSAGYSHSPYSDDTQINVGLNNYYKGGAVKQAKSTWKSSKVRKGGNSRKLAKLSGCWVCGKSHRARQFHTKQEVDECLRKLKERGVYLAVDDVVDNFLSESDPGESSTSDDDDEEVTAMMAVEVTDLNFDLVSDLTNESFIHACDATEDTLSVCNLPQFDGVMLDTGANRVSMITLDQYQAYCKGFRVPARIYKKGSKSVNGIGGRTSSIGTTVIRIPFDKLDICADVTFHVVQDSPIPNVLCLKDMIHLGFELSIQRRQLQLGDKIQPLVFKNDLLYHVWEPEFAMFTTTELQKLHRSFGHPSVKAMHGLLRRARPDQVSGDVSRALKDIAARCFICAKKARKPHRFKLTVGQDDARFNHMVAIDVMYIHGKPVLHVVDESTHFSAALFLRKVSSDDVFRALCNCWIYVYMGPPDYLHVDQGSNFVSHAFRSSSDAMGIELIAVPVECPNSLSHVERYHGPLRTVFEKLSMELPKVPKAELLQMAVSCMNNTMGPEGLCPTLCVFGAIPKPIRNLHSPGQLERAKALEKATKELQKEYANRKIQMALKYRGPYGSERDDLDNIPHGTEVLVYRQHTKQWEGLHMFISKDGDTICVQLPHGRRIFRSNVVKVAPKENSAEVNTILFNIAEEDEIVEFFRHSRYKEMDGIVEEEVFETVPRSSVPPGTRIYGTRWVDYLKNMGNGTVSQKSRLIAQNYSDEGAGAIPTKAPTISRMGQRMVVLIAAIFPDSTLYSRDITQAFIQSQTQINRDLYFEPVDEMNLPSHLVLKAKKPLYGIPESPLHWFLTYSGHHIEKLNMTPCRADPCLLYHHDDTQGSTIPNITGLQVDDSLGVGTTAFLRLEEEHSSKFKAKARHLIKDNKTERFNGTHIRGSSDGIFHMCQADKLSDITKPLDDKQLESVRAKIQYVSSFSRPDIAGISQMLKAKTGSPDAATYKKVNDLVEHCHNTSGRSLRFVPLDLNSLQLMLFTDAAFSNATGYSSQIGFVIALVDKYGKANIVHYGSQKCRRVTRSVMAAELLGLVTGFDSAFVVRYTLQELLKRRIPLQAYVDSKTTFNCVARNASTLEKRLQIDVSLLREAHSNGELDHIGWISGASNPADALTRDNIVKDDHPLVVLMTTNIINCDIQGWSVFKDRKEECFDKKSVRVSSM